jgi:hypothetical protein
MYENYYEYDESSKSNPFTIKDNDFSGNIPTHFEPNLSSCFQQTFGEREDQNIFNLGENEFNESNNNFSVLNGHQQQSEEDFILKPLNPLNSLKVNDIDSKIFDAREKEEKKMNEKKKEKSFQVFNLKKTSNASIKSEQLNPVIVKAFSEKIYQRIDYGKKYFKTNFSSFLKNYANRLIQKSYLPKNLKQKISSPNSLSFTSNVNDSDNLAFLSFSVQKIFCYYKESNRCQNSLQIKNQKKIENIMNYIENCENDSKYEKIYCFFKMSLEDAYELFYESEEFKRYAETSKAIEQDKEFKAQKRISLLEKNGFIKMIKICK